jgi:predicted RNA-binding protein with PUA-like domain
MRPGTAWTWWPSSTWCGSVALAEIKATPTLKDMVLVRNSRLSVQPFQRENGVLFADLAASLPLESAD